MCFLEQARNSFPPYWGEVEAQRGRQWCAQGHQEGVDRGAGSESRFPGSHLWVPRPRPLLAGPRQAPGKASCPGVVLSQASLTPPAREALPLSPARQPCCPTRGQEPSLAAFGGHPSRTALSCAEFSTQHGFSIPVCPARQASAAGRRGTWRPERAWC